jgi:hypothetical protein
MPINPGLAAYNERRRAEAAAREAAKSEQERIAALPVLDRAISAREAKAAERRRILLSGRS